MNKKVEDSSTMELYDGFKEGMINLVKSQYEQNASNPGMIEPMVFVGVRKSVINSLKKNLPGAFEKMEKMEKELDEIIGDNEEMRDYVDNYSINCVGIPIGKFFNDTGFPALNEMSKMACVSMVKDAISKMSEDNMTNVMFTVFISEAWVVKRDMTEKEKNNRKMGISIKPEELEKAVNSPDKVESVMMSFETRQQSQLVTIPIKRMGDYCELGEIDESPLSFERSIGIMAGFLQSKDGPTMN